MMGTRRRKRPRASFKVIAVHSADWPAPAGFE